MALVKSYTFDFGRLIPALTDGNTVTAGLLWTMVHQLTGQLGGLTTGIWTCEGSADASTSGMDGVNRWWNGGVFNAALLPYAFSLAAARGWMVLKSPATLPGGPLWLLIDRSHPTGAGSDFGYTHCFISLSTVAPTIASTWARPTSIGTIACWWEKTAYGERASWRAGDTTFAVSRKCHLILADDGAFLWANNKLGGEIAGHLGVWPLLDTDAADLRSTVLIMGPDHANTAKVPWQLSSAGLGVGSSLALQGLCNYNLALNNAADEGTYSCRGMWGFAAKIGDTTSVLNLTPLVPISVREDTMGYNAGAIADPAFCNTAYPLDQIRNRYIEMPVYLRTARVPSAAFRSVRGKLRDIAWAINMGEGMNDPVGTDPITRVVWGDIWVPSPDATWSP